MSLLAGSDSRSSYRLEYATRCVWLVFFCACSAEAAYCEHFVTAERWNVRGICRPGEYALEKMNVQARKRGVI